MRLDGIHHVTCITGDARRNLDFYTGTLGLRLVKKTINQDSVSPEALRTGRISPQDEAALYHRREVA